MKAKKIKTTYVLKNGENALEFTNVSTMKAYYKRFLSLFPDTDISSVGMFKVIVYDLKNE